MRFAGFLQPNDLTVFEDGTCVIEQHPIAEWPVELVEQLEADGFEVPGVWRLSPRETQRRTRRACRFYQLGWWAGIAGRDVDYVNKVACAKVWLDEECRKLGNRLEIWLTPVVTVNFEYLVVPADEDQRPAPAVAG